MIKQKHYQVGNVRVKIKSFEERMRELAGRERIQGVVDVWQWDPKAYSKPEEVPENHKVYLVKGAKNKLVKNFAIAIYNAFSEKTEPVIDWNGNSVTPDTYHNIFIDTSASWTGPRLGADTTTKTEYTTYRLASEINIDRDSLIIGYYENCVIYTNTWKAGKVTDTIGEIGLVARTSASGTNYKTLFGRIASADGAFEPFTPDPTLNLTVNYKIMW